MTLVGAEHADRTWSDPASSEAAGNLCSWIPWELGIPGVQGFFVTENLRVGWKLNLFTVAQVWWQTWDQHADFSCWFVLAFSHYNY